MSVFTSFCHYTNAKSVAGVINKARISSVAKWAPTGFDTLEHFWQWIGQTCKPHRLPNNRIVWVTNKLHFANNGPGKVDFRPDQSGRWFGYVWVWPTPDGQLVEEIFLKQKGFDV